MKILIFAAHPDDEVLGIGGTICKHVKDGDDVYVCIVTQAYEPEWSKKYIREKIQEQRKVDALLGIKKRFNLGLPTVKLNTMPHGEFNRKISDIVETVKPDIIYTHFGDDLNYDHTLIYRATLVAARPPKRIRLLCYETLSETEWGTRQFHPNFWIDITGCIEKKIRAFHIYKSEVKKYPHPRSGKGIKAFAMKRGSEVNTDYAEAFMLVRDCWI